MEQAAAKAEGEPAGLPVLGEHCWEAASVTGSCLSSPTPHPSPLLTHHPGASPHLLQEAP